MTRVAAGYDPVMRRIALMATALVALAGCSSPGATPSSPAATPTPDVFTVSGKLTIHRTMIEASPGDPLQR